MRAKQMVANAEGEARTAGEAQARRAIAHMEQAPDQLRGELGEAARSGDETSAAAVNSARAVGDEAHRGAADVRRDGSRASTAIAAASSTLGDLVSPAIALLEPGRAAATGGKLEHAGQAATGGAAPASTGRIGAGSGDLGRAAVPTWDCDLSEVLAIAEKVKKGAVADKVGVGERKSGAERLAHIAGFGSAMSQKIAGAGARVNAFLGQVRAGARGHLSSLASPFAKAADAAAAGLARRFETLRTEATARATKAREGLMRGIEKVAGGAAAAVNGLAATAKSKLSSAASKISKLLGSIGSALGISQSDSGFAQSIPARIEQTNGFLQNLSRTVRDQAVSMKKRLIEAGEAFLDGRLRIWAEKRRLSQRLLDAASKAVKTAAKTAWSTFNDAFGKHPEKLIEEARRKMKSVQAAADKLVAEVRDGACKVLGGAAGPCVRQHLPDLGGGFETSVALRAKGDATIPLIEIGVPGNLKVGAGAVIEVSVRSGIYTLKLSGDAVLFLNETFGGEKTTEVSAPSLPATNLGETWKALGAGPGASPSGTERAAGALGGRAGGATRNAVGAAASIGAPSSLAPEEVGAGGGVEGEVNAGLKGSTEAVWHFDAAKADTSCEGIGGLVTLLTMLGVASALPAPFSTIGANAVNKSFMDRLQYCRFSVGLGAEASADLKLEGAGKLKGRVAADVSENFEVARDRLTGELVAKRTRTLTGELDASVLGRFTVGGLEPLMGFLAGQGIVRLTLGYQPPPKEAIVPSSLGAAIKVSLGAKNFDPASLLVPLSKFIPADALGEARQLLARGLPGMHGPRELAVGLTVGGQYDNLEPIGLALKDYFDTHPPHTVTVKQVIEIVKANLHHAKPTHLVKLEIRQTQRKRLATGAVEGQGVAAGGHVDLSGERTISKAWANYGGRNDVMEAAAAMTPMVGAVIEPKDKPDQDEKCSRCAPYRDGTTPDYGAVDDFGRPRGIRAILKVRPDEGTPAGGYKPPGWTGGGREGSNQARAHLLAQSLGGDGSGQPSYYKRNLVTFDQGVNRRAYDVYEREAFKTVVDNPAACFEYVVTPGYLGIPKNPQDRSNLMPHVLVASMKNLCDNSYVFRNREVDNLLPH